MLRKLALAAGATAVALGVVVPSAGAGGPRDVGAKLERTLETLDLDDPTREAVLAVLDAARPTQRALRASVRDARREMDGLLAQPGTTEEVLVAKADALEALHAELRKHELRTLLQVRGALSPEQQEQLGRAMRHGARCRSDGPVGRLL